MDNLRVALTVLIVFQHASFAYATANWWYFIDAKQQPLLASFFIVNRSFRMSLFFLIAGYFMPYVLDRKGARRLPERSLPALRHTAAGVPVRRHPAADVCLFSEFPPLRVRSAFSITTSSIYWGIGRRAPDNWSGPAWPDRQFGHLWFLEMLLVYAVIYAGWRALRHRLQIAWPDPLRFPGLPVWLLIIAGRRGADLLGSPQPPGL